MIESIGAKLKRLRKERKKTIREVATQTRISPSAIGMYERGERTPTMQTAVILSQYFGIPLDELIDIEKDDAEIVTNVVCKNHLLKDEVLIAKERSNSNCELCGKMAPFIDNNGEPFLEVYRLFKPTINNKTGIVMLCPNCKRKMEILNLEGDYNYLKSLILKAD